MADQFTLRIWARKVVVLHDGLPTSEFPEVSPTKVRAFRDRYHLDGNLLVGLVGRIKIGRKGQDILLDAAVRLKPRFPDTRFSVYRQPFSGNEDHLARLRELIAEKNMDNEIIYTGDLEDVKTAYAALDISVQSSVLRKHLAES